MARLTFGTDGWRDVIADGYTFANVRRAARAYAAYLRTAEAGAGDAPVVVGYDTRFMAREFAFQVAQVLQVEGRRALVSSSYLPTPALSFAVKHLGAAGGVMLTASHNPPRYGGFKLKGPYGGTATDDIYRAVAALVPDSDVPEPAPGNMAAPGVTVAQQIDTFDIRADYYAAITALVDIDAIARAMPTIAHDSLGGAGSGWLTGLAEATRAFDVVPLRGRPDPLFHGVNPEPIPANLATTQEWMRSADARRTGALFATVTDGDADRIGVVLPGGEYFNSHQIFAVLLDHLAATATGRVVKTFTVSRLIERLAAARGLEVVETPVGFKYIVDAMLANDSGAAAVDDGAQGGAVLIGGEESGGIGVKGHVPERDAIANTLLLLEAVVTSGASLAERFAAIEREVGLTHAYDRVDLHLAADGTKERVMGRLTGGDVDAVIGRPWRVTSVEDRDGVKLNLARDGDAEPTAWLLVRASGTEPVLRLYCEAPDDGAVAALLGAAQRFVTAR